MKRNSAAFLALLLSTSLVVTPAASVLADSEVSDQSEAVETVSEENESEAETETAAEEIQEETAVETVEEAAPAEETAESESEETDDAAADEKAETAEETKSDSMEVNTVSDTEKAAAEDAEDTNTETAEEKSEISGTYGITTVTTNASGDVSGMYTMDSVTVTEQSDGTYLVRMHQTSANRNILAVTDSKDAATAHEADWNMGSGEDGYWFVISVSSLTDPVYFCMSSIDRIASGKEFGNVMTLTFDTDSISETDADEVTESEINVDPAAGAEDPDDGREDEKGDDSKGDDSKDETSSLEDGVYTGLAETNATMFKVTGVKLTSKDGSMTAVVTLSGSGYDYLYMGTKEEAYASDESAWIPAVVDENGLYTYEIPVSALDTPLTVASRSKKYAAAGKGVDAWLDRTITILSSSLTKISDSTAEDSGSTGGNTSGGSSTSGGSTSGGSSSSGGSTSGGSSSSGSGTSSGTQTPTGNDGKAESESKYESDLSGSTAAVDSSTTLKDGVYTPSAFSWSGGTGKVSISCNKVTVTNGQAYATLVFSSSKYGYVKANGNTYYPTVSGGTTIFTIPVELNKNQQIIGMTTAMSSPHEITYSIFVALPVDGSSTADTSESVSGLVSSGNSVLDETAPEIVGLTYESETVLEEAEYFKIYNYENGITLLEIDLTKDTLRDPELEEETDEEEDTDSEKDADSSDSSRDNAEEESSSSQETGMTAEELTAELYKGNVVKYLIVPEDQEVPTGIEKDMVVIQLPTENLYMAADDDYENLEDLDSLDLIKAVAVEEEDCTNETIAEAMEDETVIYGGTAEKPSFKKLVKAKVDLAVLPETVLPGNLEEDTKEEDVDLEEETEDFVSLTEKFALLGIPAVIDRSADEDSEIAEAEWIKVYGVLTDQLDEAEKLFDQFVEENQ